MYASIWTLLVLISLVVSVAAFFWGLSAGQFANAERARYLPFTSQEPGPETAVRQKNRLPFEVYVLGAIVVTGLLIFTAPVILTVITSW